MRYRLPVTQQILSILLIVRWPLRGNYHRHFLTQHVIGRYIDMRYQMATRSVRLVCPWTVCGPWVFQDRTTLKLVSWGLIVDLVLLPTVELSELQKRSCKQILDVESCGCSSNCYDSYDNMTNACKSLEFKVKQSLVAPPHEQSGLFGHYIVSALVLWDGCVVLIACVNCPPPPFPEMKKPPNLII